MTDKEARRILIDIATQMPSDVCADWIDAIGLGIKALDQELFINKSCVSSGICEHDKNKVLDKIRAEIEEEYGDYNICEWYENYDYEENDTSEYMFIGNVSDILAIIDKYKESEDKE